MINHNSSEKKTILLVDDEIIFANATSRKLQLLGYDTILVNPGKDDATEQIPGYDIINKTANGFTVELTFSLTGKMDYLAWHP
jgi:ActR/RegA family two-component response regulator